MDDIEIEDAEVLPDGFDPYDPELVMGDEGGMIYYSEPKPAQPEATPQPAPQAQPKPKPRPSGFVFPKTIIRR